MDKHGTGRVSITVTDAVAVADPEVAVIVAVPSATEVAKPVDEIVATDAAEVAHDTLAPLIVAPFWSLTVAESCCVAPIDEKFRFVADRVIEVATGGGGVGGGAVGLSSPPQLTKSSENDRVLNGTVLFIRPLFSEVFSQRIHVIGGAKPCLSVQWLGC